MKRLEVYVFVLACMFAAGCDEDSSSGSEMCGNGVIDSIEMCDGKVFADGARVCPDGLQLVDMDAFTCTEKCHVDFSKACKAMGREAIENCGDGEVSGSEMCDGNLFAENAKQCPDGMILIHENAFKCTDKCQIDYAQACRLPECGDGIVSADETCDGDAFADGAKKCPDGLVLFDQNAFLCTNYCRVDYSMACDISAVCGDQKLAKAEICDGDMFADKLDCPEGYVRNEGRHFSCDACKLVSDSACRKKDNREPLLYISDYQTVDIIKDKWAGAVYFEIGNLGDETNLRDCHIVGFNMDPDDPNKYDTTPLIDIPLQDVKLGNSIDDAKNIYTVCFEHETGYIESTVDLTKWQTDEDCKIAQNNVDDDVEKCIEKCGKEPDISDKNARQIWEACESACYDLQISLTEKYYWGCYNNLKRMEILNACDSFITDRRMIPNVYQYDSSSYSIYYGVVDGLGIQCGDVIFDVMRYDYLIPGIRMCPVRDDIASIVPTGNTVVDTEVTEDKTKWMFSHENGAGNEKVRFGRAGCGVHNQILN